MKKTLVALAVAAVAATSANAAVVYNQDGSKLEVNGSVRVLLNKVTDQRADLENDGSRLIFNAEQDLGNGLSALGQAELRFEGGSDTFISRKVTVTDLQGQNQEHELGQSNDNFGSPTLKRLFAGLKQEGVGTLTFGRQALSADDVQLGDYTYKWGGNNNLVDEADKAVKFKSADFAGFSFGVDYAFGDSKKTNESLKNIYGASLFYTVALGQNVTLNTAAGYQQVKFDPVVVDAVTGQSFNMTEINWRLAAELESGPFAVAYNYGQTKVKNIDGKKAHHLLGVKFDATDVSTLYAQWNSEKVTGEKRLNKYILGVDYKLHKNVVTFAEYARVKKDDSANAFGVGLRVYF